MKVGRNDPCPCGSGNKYKKCCYTKDEAARAAKAAAARAAEATAAREAEAAAATGAAATTAEAQPAAQQEHGSKHGVRSRKSGGMGPRPKGPPPKSPTQLRRRAV